MMFDLQLIVSNRKYPLSLSHSDLLRRQRAFKFFAFVYKLNGIFNLE